MRTSALVAACHSKACAPPPTGSGGSDKAVRSGGTGGSIKGPNELVRRAMSTNTVDAFKTIHNAALGYDEIAAVNDALDMSTVKPGSVKNASRHLYEESQRLLERDGFPEEFTVLRKGRLDTGVVSVSTRPLEYLKTSYSPEGQIAYTVRRRDVLTYAEGLMPRSAFAEDELQVDGKLLRPASIVAACYSAACRPPTSGGTGGSSPAGTLSALSRSKAAKARGSASSNTSIYPVDTHSVTRPSDANPLAPGHDNRAAVRGHKGVHGTDPERRIPRMGETVDIYRDLGKGREHKRGFPDNDAFSVRPASGSPGNRVGEVVASAVAVVLTNGRPAWAHSSKQEAEVAGKRGVHGFIRGEVREYVTPSVLEARVRADPSYKKVTYYPGTQDFFMPGSRHRFVGAEEVVLVKGEFFAKNPLTVPIPTPVSPIERRLGLTASATMRNALIAACNSKACAPPPTGKGGSLGGVGKKGQLRDFQQGQRVSVRGSKGTVVQVQGQGRPYAKGYVKIAFDEAPDRPVLYPYKEVLID